MHTLEIYNKAEEGFLGARSLQELMEVAEWLNRHFEENPTDRATAQNQIIRRKSENDVWIKVDRDRP